jgi:peptidoglycan/xylan/chitin deacetylase (PgdA/CDA1 family)
VSAPPILCYHKIDARFELGFTRLGPRAFRRQMTALVRAGYRAIGSGALADAVRAPTLPRAPSPSVVLTFDDGYEALAEHAFPVLADLGQAALVFVITDYVGRENRWDVQYGWRSFRHLTWDQLGAWQERGIEVHSHGATHARLTWLPDDQVAEELGRSREAITARLGRTPAGFSYPFGAADERIRRLALAAGYTLGFAGPAAVPPGSSDPLLLGRLPVYAWDAFDLPWVLDQGARGDAARGIARLTNRCAVGTAAIQRAFGGRYRDRPR